MSWLGKFFSKRNVTKKANIVLLGASGAGKTTLVRYLETGQPVLEDPRTTLGIDIRQKPINIAGWELSAIDVGGQELYRESLWALGVSQSDAIVYVIDGTVKPSSDNDLFEVSRFSFDYMLSIVDAKKPLLILINKQDLSDEKPLSVKEAMNYYNIDKLVGRSFNIIPTSAKYGNGIDIAMTWLVEKIK